jgi:hypothetical protein
MGIGKGCKPSLFADFSRIIPSLFNEKAGIG